MNLNFKNQDINFRFTSITNNYSDGERRLFNEFHHSCIKNSKIKK